VKRLLGHAIALSGSGRFELPVGPRSKRNWGFDRIIR
jgi:hypothetical protein